MLLSMFKWFIHFSGLTEETDSEQTELMIQVHVNNVTDWMCLTAWLSSKKTAYMYVFVYIISSFPIIIRCFCLFTWFDSYYVN